MFEVEGVGKVRGGLYLQSYKVKGDASRAIGWYDDGRVAVVENAYGKGRTRLVGTVPGYGYDRHPEQASRKFFSSILSWAGKEQHVRLEDPRLTARLHHGEGGTYLWVTNPTKEPLSTRLELLGNVGAVSRWRGALGRGLPRRWRASRDRHGAQARRSGHEAREW